MISQLSFLPDNDREPTVRRPSVPVARLIGGRWCWLVTGTNEYQHEPELEQILLNALERRAHRRAA